MILKVEQAGDAILRQTARTLTQSEINSKQVQEFIDYMVETLRDYTGVGLAAPQVGSNVRIIVVEDKDDYLKDIPANVLAVQKRRPVALKIIINPVITDSSNDDVLFFEGCLSIDGFRAIVPRATSVTVTGLDRYGNTVSYDADGWFARIIQHEVDHLNCALYVDTMLSKTFMTDTNFKKHWAKSTSSKLSEYIEESR